MHILFRCRAVLAEDINEFQVAASLVVFRAQHAHCRQEREAHPLLPIKTAQQKNGPVGDGLKSPCRNRDTCLRRERQGDGLPQDSVDLISLVRKLGNREMPVAVPDRSFRTGTAER